MKISELFDKHGSDKNERHRYGYLYDMIFEKITPLRVLEIGVLHGASGMAFREAGCIYTGVDKDLCEGFNVIQANAPDFTNVVNYCTSNDCMFDLMIDDGSHAPTHQYSGLEHLYKFLRTGGFYVIEDISDFRWLANLVNNHDASIVDLRLITGHADSCIAYWRK